MENFNTIIIGAGAAGLFAAANISTSGKVMIIEKNNSPGKKLLIAGAGRCNITNAGEIDDFFNHYGDNARFLKTALISFDNLALINYFRDRGVEIITDKNGKIFPESQKASDILDVLLKEIKKRKVFLKTGETVGEIIYNNELFEVSTNNGKYITENVIISTGGKSYPVTGSTGDGYIFAEKLGHTIIKPEPALTNISVKDYVFEGIAGVSLSKKNVYLYREGKKLNEHCGDLVFTHSGLSGPAIIDFSRYISDGDTLKVNFIDISLEKFNLEFIDAAGREGKTHIKRFIKQFEIPESLIKIILEKAGINIEDKIADIDKKKRTVLGEYLTGFPFAVDKKGDFTTAMVTTGGVSLKEVSPKTMESKIIPKLYFGGEVLDIDGDTGGYNIQAAFSTGYLAARAISEERE